MLRYLRKFTGLRLPNSKAAQIWGVVENGTSNYRVDNQPSDVVRLAGDGREGPAFSIHVNADIRRVALQ